MRIRILLYRASKGWGNARLAKSARHGAPGKELFAGRGVVIHSQAAPDWFFGLGVVTCATQP